MQTCNQIFALKATTLNDNLSVVEEELNLSTSVKVQITTDIFTLVKAEVPQRQPYLSKKYLILIVL